MGEARTHQIGFFFFCNYYYAVDLKQFIYYQHTFDIDIL